jgi:hypothetical protein
VVEGDAVDGDGVGVGCAAGGAAERRPVRGAAAGVEEELGERVVHLVDEELLRAGEVDLRDLPEGEAGVGGQKRADVEVEAGGRAGAGRDVGDLTVGVEGVLGEDGDFVGVDGGVGFVEDAGDADDAAGGERADGLVVVPLGGAVDVDGELTAVRALDDEGLRGGVDADDGGVELVDVGAGVADGDGGEVEGGRDHAGDGSVGDLDGLARSKSKWRPTGWAAATIRGEARAMVMVGVCEVVV